MPRTAVDPEQLTVQPLTPQTWPAFEALGARHNGVWGGCWCTWFHQGTRDAPELPPGPPSAERSRLHKKALVERGIAHAALVLLGERAVGWAEYGTPDELPNIHHRAQYLSETDRLPDFRITCLFVDRDFRGSGVAARAVRGALDLIAQAGGGVVESYPHDLEPGTRKSSSFLYNATRSMYEQLGFTYLRPKGKGNCVMTTTVEPAAPRATG